MSIYGTWTDKREKNVVFMSLLGSWESCYFRFMKILLLCPSFTCLVDYLLLGRLLAYKIVNEI